MNIAKLVTAVVLMLACCVGNQVGAQQQDGGAPPGYAELTSQQVAAPIPAPVPLPEMRPPEGMPPGPPVAPSPPPVGSAMVEPNGYAGPVEWDQNRVAIPPDSLDAIGPCCTHCGGGSGCPALWTADEGIEILARGRPRATPLATVPTFVPTVVSGVTVGGSFVNQPVLSGKSLTFDIAPGLSADAIRYLGRDTRNQDWFLEGRFSGFEHWQAGTQVDNLTTADTTVGAVTATHGTILSPFKGLYPGLDFAQHMAYTYQSWLYDGEINLQIRPRAREDRLVLQPNGEWIRECQPGDYFSFLVGVRYLQVNEIAVLYGESAATTTAVPGATYDISGNYWMRTHSALIGFQIGGDVMFQRCMWNWGIRYKLSPLIDIADQAARVQTTVPVPGYAGQQGIWVDNKTKTAGLADIGVVGNYKLSPTFALQAGYDFHFVTGVALAPEQMTNPGHMNANGYLYFHGLTLGAEWRR